MGPTDGVRSDALLTPASLAELADFELGAAIVSPSRRIVTGPGGRADVEPRVMQVLVVLAQAAGAVVTRETLFSRCWGGVYVGDDSLNRAVGAVRRLAAEIAGGSFEIETIPRTGYRLIGASSPVVAADPELPAAALPARTISRRWLVGGSIAALAGGGLWLVGRKPADPRFSALMEQAEAGLRDGTVPAVQQSVRLLEQAAARRPEEAKPWGLLAYAHANLADIGTPVETAASMADAERAARKAFAIDRDEPYALTAGILLQGSMLDRKTTDDRLRSVLAIDPRNVRAMEILVALLQAAGLDAESWSWNERAVALEPLSPIHQFRRAFKHWIAGRIPQADMVIDRAAELWPLHPGVWNARFIIRAFTGRAGAALAMLEDEQASPRTFTPAAIAVWRASLAALDQPSPKAVAAATQAVLSGARTGPGIAAQGVMILGGLGQVDAAFEVAQGFLLSRGPIVVRQPGAKRVPVNDPGWRWTQWLFTPPAAPLRADPRFGSLCDGIGLTDYWRKRGVEPDYRKSQS